jgi:DNA-directed RNA polymerase subunit RPC12/RpoP
MNRPGYQRRSDFDALRYEQLIQTSIGAIKGGDRVQAATLLRKASEMKPTDPHPWLWLSATTDDLQAQRDYLEHALAADPNNGAARRGLVLLSEKLDKTRLLAEGQGVAGAGLEGPQDAQVAEDYVCPKCGGRMQFSVEQQGLACVFCGYLDPGQAQSAADSAEQPIDFVLPTSRGHRWAEAQHRLRCERCGATALLPEGETTSECPNCGSHRLIESAETEELLDPQVIALARLDRAGAVARLRDWLGSGLFAPDDLKKLAQTSDLRPAFYPFWTFDGTLEMNWSGDVRRRVNLGMEVWEPQSGVEYEIFDDVLVPGWRALSPADLKELGPFQLKEMVEFDPRYLAGWQALAYDIPLAQASLAAREQISRELRRKLYQRVAPGSPKRDLRSGAVNWSGVTYKLALLPLWVGSYRYQGRAYRLLINAQTGKVCGEKPKDNVKIAAIAAAGLLALFLAALLFLALAFSVGWLPT